MKTQTPVFTLPGLLVRAAEADHDRVAVSGDSAHLTYGELEDRSSQLAAALVDLNVRPGDRVAVFAAKSTDAVVALYAIMRAGAVYVPIDPLSPPLRAAVTCPLPMAATARPRSAMTTRP